MASSLVFVSWMVLGLAMATSTTQVNSARAFFVFGDSLVDNGNNNFLATTARADSPPYGIDTPNRRPTGRFSNGKNIPDFISEALGSEPTLPYLSPELRGDRLLVGANFASAGIGILNDTGVQFVNPGNIFLNLLKFHARLTDLVGYNQARQIVNNALVLITVGGNDFVNNYYLIPFSPRSRQFSLPDYVRYLISEYKKLLMRLYDLGARKVLVTGTGPMGCVPAELAMRSPSGQCDTELQRAAALYNPQLVNMINELNSQHGSNIFIAANTQQQTTDFNDPAYGFTTSKVACCGQGPYNGLGLCTVVSNLCPNRDEYAFWDPFHPSEKANGIIVNMILSGSVNYMSPMNLSSLLALDTKTKI
ncbi:GDSL esterase/lipase [Hibiscus syriacus]|uniref:GDSL esterase/lipase n=1 Tax=Hibiscus syriacus TaxID=106335 RepID=A0A6A2XKR5_HIBSY|nr:GDSL esterase/lipase [Hibiscus syriacus]